MVLIDAWVRMEFPIVHRSIIRSVDSDKLFSLFTAISIELQRRLRPKSIFALLYFSSQHSNDENNLSMTLNDENFGDKQRKAKKTHRNIVRWRLLASPRNVMFSSRHKVIDIGHREAHPTYEKRRKCRIERREKTVCSHDIADTSALLTPHYRRIADRR